MKVEKLRQMLKDSVRNGDIDEQDVVWLIDSWCPSGNLYDIAWKTLDGLNDDDVLEVAECWNIEYEITPKQEKLTKTRGKNA